MIVCICQGINDKLILEKFEEGDNDRQVILELGCDVCGMCNEYIHEMYEEYLLLH